MPTKLLMNFHEKMRENEISTSKVMLRVTYVCIITQKQSMLYFIFKTLAYFLHADLID